MHNNFKTANEAFHDLYWRIVRDGVDFAGTKALFNVGFCIENPALNDIKDSKVKRNWSIDYAEAEWQWYLSGDRNIAKLGELYGKVPAIWKRMADDEGNVNSNYGWQWYRNDQYQFSNLQMYVAYELNLPVGIYYHFAHNLHLYNDKI